jgi:trk system potassium uptake protein
VLAVANVLGSLIAVFGGLYLLPISWSLIAGDGTFVGFFSAAAINTASGLAIAFATRRFRRELKPRDGFLLVTLACVVLSASACVPLLLALPQLSFTDAYFEAMSGLTSTGATVLSGLDRLPPSINLWRCALHWFGGLGFIVLSVAVMPLLGVGGMQVYRADSPGRVKDEKLTPRIMQTAKALWLAYSAMTVGGILLLKSCGMSCLDAICHGFSVMGLGAFSTHDANIAYFKSSAVEFVLIVLMLIASLNFSRHFVALRRLTFTPYTKDPEAKAMFLIIGASVLGIAVLLVVNGTYPDFESAFRHAAFNVVSMATTTGFVSQNFAAWPVFAPVWMLFLCCITCSTGSPGGGVKMVRTLLLARQATREMRLLVHPSAVTPIRIGGNVIANRIAYSVLAFIFLYFMTAVGLTFALLLSGLDFMSAFSAIIACINNTGPGLGVVGPTHNYSTLTDLQTWICTAAMLLGRLEIFSVLVLFTRMFWRK